MDFDRDSIQRDGDKVTLWARLTFDEPVRSGRQLVKSMQAREQFDCKAGTRQRQLLRAYRADGSLIAEEPADSEPQAPIQPDSGPAYVLRRVCPASGAWTHYDDLEPTGTTPAAHLDYDAAKLERTDATVTTWGRTRYATPNTIGKHRVALLDVRTRYDCTAGTSQDLAIRAYDSDLTLVFETDEPGELLTLTPNTIGHDHLTFFCAKP